MSSQKSLGQQKIEEDKKHDEMASQLLAVHGAQVFPNVLQVNNVQRRSPLPVPMCNDALPYGPECETYKGTCEWCHNQGQCLGLEVCTFCQQAQQEEQQVNQSEQQVKQSDAHVFKPVCPNCGSSNIVYPIGFNPEDPDIYCLFKCPTANCFKIGCYGCYDSMQHNCADFPKSRLTQDMIHAIENNWVENYAFLAS